MAGVPKGGIGAGAETIGAGPAAGGVSEREGSLAAGTGVGVNFGVGESDGADFGLYLEEQVSKG